MNEQIIQNLFSTGAIKVCPADKPFWYTSGKIGPFYVNTEFLYGSAEKSKQILEDIEIALQNKDTLDEVISEKVWANYQADQTYKQTMDALADYAKKNINLAEIDYISGGERRDWIFSFVLSKLLGIPHITLFKDGDFNFQVKDGSSVDSEKPLAGKRILHVVDLVNTSSSHKEMWIPFLESAGGKMTVGLAVVDRDEGGAEVLAGFGVQSHALAYVQNELFVSAQRKGILTADQVKMIADYKTDPTAAMDHFLNTHPEFIPNALAGDEKLAARAQKCIDLEFYPALKHLKK